MSKRDYGPIPIFDTPIIETHFHMDMIKTNPCETILLNSKNSNIEKLITISTSENNFDTVIQLSNQFSEIFCTQGVHPHDAKNWVQTTEEKIIRNLKDPSNKKIVAIGEIGLDYYYSKSERNTQIKVFETQLDLAIQFNLPVVIHSRDADDDMEAILKNFKSLKKGVIHSFTSGIKLANFALSENFYLGFNGIITFKNAENVREVLRITPMENLLLETDAPFLTPIPYRGVENSPAYLPYVPLKIAEVKNCEINELLNICYQNSHKLFTL